MIARFSKYRSLFLVANCTVWEFLIVLILSFEYFLLDEKVFEFEDNLLGVFQLLLHHTKLLKLKFLDSMVVSLKDF